MADETNAPAVQPIQPELSAMDKARAADTRAVITLNAQQAYDELELFGTEPGTYRDDSPVQGEFWRFKFRGAIVTVSPEFKQAYDDGTMISITATPTLFERTVADPNNAGANKQVILQGWSLSFTDITKREKAAKAITAASTINLKMQIQEMKMKKQVEMLEKTDISQFITEDDMAALLKEV